MKLEHAASSHCLACACLRRYSLRLVDISALALCRYVFAFRSPPPLSDSRAHMCPTLIVHPHLTSHLQPSPLLLLLYCTPTTLPTVLRKRNAPMSHQPKQRWRAPQKPCKHFTLLLTHNNPTHTQNLYITLQYRYPCTPPVVPCTNRPFIVIVRCYVNYTTLRTVATISQRPPCT